MTRICVFGDSHIVALKAGWTSIADEFQGTDITFFGAGQQRMKDLAVKDNTLVATSTQLRTLFERTSGGMGYIAGDFDGYILCGLGVTFARVAPTVRDYRSESHALKAKALLSDARYRARLLEQLHDTLMAGILEKLRKITHAPIVLLAAPFPNRRPFFDVMAATGDDQIVSRFLVSVLDEIAGESDARFVPQPPETLKASALTTNPDFFQGAVRLFEGSDDQTHANADYGAIVLRNALRNLCRF